MYLAIDSAKHAKCGNALMWFKSMFKLKKGLTVKKSNLTYLELEHELDPKLGKFYKNHQLSCIFSTSGDTGLQCACGPCE